MDQVHFGGYNELGFQSNQNNPTVAASMQDLNWMSTRSRASCRGFFWQRRDSKFRDVLDGLANTIAAGEQNTSGQQREISADWVRGITGTDANPSLCKTGLHIDPARPQFYDRAASVSAGNTEGQGVRWADYRPKYSAITTVLPPNSPSCTTGNNDNSEGWHSVGSRHQGGAHVLMGDGAVVFMTDSVETGDLTAPPVERGSNNLGWMGAGTDPGNKSPYGLWGALGTRAMKETIEEQLNQ
jgi:prepilin-type processing-associated H-X9-DG protein